MAKTDLVIELAELRQISFRCKCGTALSFDADKDIAWRGSCPSCSEPMDVVRLWKSFRNFQPDAQAEGAPSVKFRVAVENRKDVEKGRT